jgi:hypothetical protein
MSTATGCKRLAPRKGEQALDKYFRTLGREALRRRGVIAWVVEWWATGVKA